jgi:hypothetical protein
MILKELNGSNWRLLNGGRHFHLRIDDRLVAVLPRGPAANAPNARGWRSVISNIRRHQRRAP